MRNVLVTGFGPFPGAPFNPSGPLVKKLTAIRRPAFAGVRLIGHIFPTSYQAVDHELPDLVARHRPVAILMFGLATRSRHVRIETQARNALAAAPDVSGFSPDTLAILPQRQQRLPVRAPRSALLQAARGGKIPARLSRDAGRYLCNYLYWRALECGAQPSGPKLVAFIHIPNTRSGPDRRRRKRRRFAFGDVLRTGQAVLAAVIAALNRPRPE